MQRSGMRIQKSRFVRRKPVAKLLCCVFCLLIVTRTPRSTVQCLRFLMDKTPSHLKSISQPSGNPAKLCSCRASFQPIITLFILVFTFLLATGNLAGTFETWFTLSPRQTWSSIQWMASNQCAGRGNIVDALSAPRCMRTMMLPCNRCSPRRRTTITTASEDIARLNMNVAVRFGQKRYHVVTPSIGFSAQT